MVFVRRCITRNVRFGEANSLYPAFAINDFKIFISQELPRGSHPKFWSYNYNRIQVTDNLRDAFHPAPIFIPGSVKCIPKHKAFPSLNCSISAYHKRLLIFSNYTSGDNSYRNLIDISISNDYFCCIHISFSVEWEGVFCSFGQNNTMVS